MIFMGMSIESIGGRRGGGGREGGRGLTDQTEHFQMHKCEILTGCM